MRNTENHLLHFIKKGNLNAKFPFKYEFVNMFIDINNSSFIQTERHHLHQMDISASEPYRTEVL